VGDLTLWPVDGRSLAVVLRRLVVHLDRKGVRVSIGHRGYRGKRLIGIEATDHSSVARTQSAASRRRSEKAAPSKGTGSARSRADGRVTGFTGTIQIDSEVLASFARRREAETSPVDDPLAQDEGAPAGPRRAR
jgi:hypothetical protein